MIEFCLKFIRRVYGKLIGFKIEGYFNETPPEFAGQESSDIIFDRLMSSEPCMISRFGVIELNAVKYYKIDQGSKIIKYIKYIKGEIDDIRWPKGIKETMEVNAGFFPATDENLVRFSKLMLSDIANIDILGSLINLENDFKDEIEHTTTVKFEDLNAYYHDNPWTRVLKGKKVLVIHPFAESIKSQYKRKELIFENKDVLPDFELFTYKPVQSLGGSKECLDHKDWFEALEMMKNDISKIDFDIALIGCGAYGLPLASYVKSIGKKGIHIGGATQILFGIIGRRWETEYDMSKFVNEYWVRPSLDERPENFKSVENGCYW